MRDAYAMHLHSVPSRLSKKVIPDTSLQARWCAFLWGMEKNTPVGNCFLNTID